MKKLTLIGMKYRAEKITERLMWLGCVEIEKAGNADSRLISAYSSDGERAEKELQILREASAVLIKHGGVRHGIFYPQPRLTETSFRSGRIGDSEYSETVEAAHGIIIKKERLDELYAELGSQKSRRLSLLPFLSYRERLSKTETEHTRILLGTLPKGTDAEALRKTEVSCPINVTEISADGAFLYISVIYLKKSENTAKKLLSRLGFNRLTLEGLTDIPDAELARIKEAEDKLLSDISALERSLSDDSALYDALQIATDMASTKLRLAKARRLFLSTEKTFVLTGWIPSEHAPTLEKALKKEDVCFTLDDPTEEDDVPVYLVNGRPLGYFESVVNMYSPPKYGSFDPTGIMTVFFFIIFGLMLADAVYGLLLTFGSLFIIKRTSLSPGVKSTCGLFAVCGVSCTLFGILLGSYLGDLPARLMKEFFGIDIKVWAALDIMTEAVMFLLLSLVLGAIHMLTGMGIRFYVLWISGKRFSAVFDEGSWFVIFLGLGLWFLNATVGTAVALIGILMLILTQGRREKSLIMKAIKGVGSLYSVISYASDLLSYSRIMALGLSSAVVASVFNILGTMGGKTVIGVITLLIVVPLGHLLNLLINLLGAFVHTSRLQYVEFFGKFFEDGGRIFKPLQPDIKSSVLTEESTKAKA